MTKTKHFAFMVEYKGVVPSIVTAAGIRPAEITQRDNTETFIRISALWDTGATRSVITPELAKKLNLVPVGKMTVTGVNSQEVVNVYLIDITLPNRVLLPSVEVAESNFMGGDILVGMNIIQLGDFAIANAKGKTRFSFCIPPHDKPICLLEKTQKVDGKGKIKKVPALATNS